MHQWVFSYQAIERDAFQSVNYKKKNKKKTARFRNIKRQKSKEYNARNKVITDPKTQNLEWTSTFIKKSLKKRVLL